MALLAADAGGSIFVKIFMSWRTCRELRTHRSHRRHIVRVRDKSTQVTAQVHGQRGDVQYWLTADIAVAMRNTRDRRHLETVVKTCVR